MNYHLNQSVYQSTVLYDIILCCNAINYGLQVYFFTQENIYKIMSKLLRQGQNPNLYRKVLNYRNWYFLQLIWTTSVILVACNKQFRYKLVFG